MTSLPRFYMSCGLAACLMIGCQAPPTARLGVGDRAVAPVAGMVAPLAVGTKVNSQFYRSFAPAYRPGMRWVYVTKVSDPALMPPDTEMSLDVVEVNGDTITLELSVSGRTMRMSVSVSDNPMGWTDDAKRIDPALSFQSTGTEDVVVPAGRYAGAAKISAEVKGHKAVGWYVSGVGLVKSSVSFEVEGKSLTATTELKDFSTGDAPAGGDSTQTVPDGVFFARHTPPLKKGLRRTFKLTGTETFTSPTGEARVQPQAAERLFETIAVSGDRYLLLEKDAATSRLIRVSTFDGRQNPLVGWLIHDDGDLPFRLAGRETVTVGAGTFPEAEKLTASRSDFFSKQEVTAWLAPGVGVVKATMSAGGATEYGKLESQTTFELMAVASPDEASSTAVPPSAFESGGRLSLDGSPVPTRGRFVAEDISDKTDIVYLRCSAAASGEPASGYVVDVELRGAQKTPEGFTFAPQQARLERVQLWKDVESGPIQHFDVQPGTLELAATGDKLTGKLTFSVRSYEGGALSQAKSAMLEFDVFDRRVSR